ncbi:MAG: hypothetical protein AAF572_24405 [Cyanobacteria bacterium P01_B01_bin.77]
MSCGGGFGGCGFTTGGGSYTQSSTSNPDSISNSSEYKAFTTFMGWLFLFLIIMGGGLFIAAEVAEAKTASIHENWSTRYTVVLFDTV